MQVEVFLFMFYLVPVVAGALLLYFVVRRAVRDGVRDAMRSLDGSSPLPAALSADASAAPNDSGSK
ncbi:MAG: hypothetical protein SOW20_05360 [Berryella intestinalis]|nr:hypothetical protein [Berryella intestinalis]MDD7369913.1 hypothetical protein [Berryella intestinalis]MDY3129434.1 hypothetical protein [Berryella intestinalis]